MEKYAINRYFNKNIFKKEMLADFVGIYFFATRMVKIKHA